MAKGNLFLGMGRGKVGDVVFYRKNGDQISRVRNRSVRNPNTDAQLYQRAIMATVSKAYQAGSAIFDHSFEGIPVGARCQSRFMELNCNLLRSLVDSDVLANHGDGECQAAVVARGGSWPVANAYRISQGSLDVPSGFRIVFEDSTWEGAVQLPSYEEGQTVAEWLASNGIIDDDIFTIVHFAVIDNNYRAVDLTRFTKSFATRFGFVRLRVKTEAVTSQSVVATTKIGEIFDVEGGYADLISQRSMQSGNAIQGSDIVPRSNGVGSLGVIRSRENSGQRSNSDMVIPDGVCQWGIISKYILGQWNPDLEVFAQSPLILEGGGLTR
ncbi:MAG: hypothetical protein IKJ07_10580 [Clostridia bacterium]|nr:hypothetical protein [Clostridia bacterium]MBR4033160.1 hypothetical protein [Clostridia bacterium]